MAKPLPPEHQLGRLGEDLAAKELTRRGFEILDRNIRIGGVEIDLVARDAVGLVFVEVKTRRGSSCGYPYEAVNARKRAALAKGALEYLGRRGRADEDYRFGIVSIVAGSKDHVGQLEWIDEA